MHWVFKSNMCSIPFR